MSSGNGPRGSGLPVGGGAFLTGRSSCSIAAASYPGGGSFGSIESTGINLSDMLVLLLLESVKSVVTLDSERNKYEADEIVEFSTCPKEERFLQPCGDQCGHLQERQPFSFPCDNTAAAGTQQPSCHVSTKA